jgi:3D-(3,5/4)-trihydroxycyclohexane-1,2-dione acylhydrolase (decyclizing)
MGAQAETVDTPQALGEAVKRAKASETTYVICMKVDAYAGWTKQGHAWWEIGTPHVSDTPSVTAAHQETEAGRAKQRKGI